MKNAKKITSILIVTSMAITMFVGCSSKNADTSAKTTTTSAQPIATGQALNKKFDPVAMKTLYSNVLKSLVTAKTITQLQSDKVLAAETRNAPQSKGTSKQRGINKPNGRRPTNNKLSALVTKKVITLAQFDIINQKIQEAMKNSKSTKSTKL